jgi:glycosyltransferase involved in cell wall biosynthesis
VANFGAVNVMTLTGWLAGVPRRVAWYHTLSTQQRADSSQPAWQRGLFDLRKSLVYAAATHVVGNSRAAVADVQRVHHVQAHKCRVFPNSLADPVGHDSLLGRERSGDKVLCAGRLWPSKGQDVLIESLGLLRSRAPGLRVEFAGEGPAKDRLFGLARERRVLDRCCFLGRLPHREVLCRMAESALTVVPSRSEAFGLVVIESMAVGTPAVASAVGGIPEIIRDGVDGFLVPPDDPAALADKIGLLLSNAELRHKMGLNARERFLSRFEQSRVVKEQADWLEQIVAAGRSSTIGRSS